MNKFNLTILFFSIFIILGGIFLFSRNNTSTITTDPNAYLYFWGDGCPHCANVAAFLETWEGKDKINLQKFEVWYNTNNAKLMKEKTAICNIPPGQMGVPLMVTPDGKCLTGDTPIIDLFKSIK